MENENKTQVETVEQDTTATESTVETVENTEATYSQSDIDTIKSDYEAKISDLENKIKELTPAQKSEQELDYERRLSALEAREKAMQLSDSLKSKGLSNDLAQFLKDDADIDALSGVLNTIYKNNLKANSFVPEGHKTGESMTREQFRKLSYSEREQIYLTNPELFRQLSSR